MSKTTNLNLGNHFDKFLSSQINNDRFRNVSEVEKGFLRVMEHEEQKIEVLRQALIDGENSGDSIKWDIDAFLKRMKKKTIKK